MRALIFVTAVLATSTASAQQKWTSNLTPELHVGVIAGSGWYDWRWRSYAIGAVEQPRGMGASVGGTGHWGFSLTMPPWLTLAIHGDVLSVEYQREGFIISDAAMLFGVCIPVSLDKQRSSILLAGVFGLAFSNNNWVRGIGMTYGGLASFRYWHAFIEGRFQVFAYNARTNVPEQYEVEADLNIMQILFSAGFAL